MIVVTAPTGQIGHQVVEEFLTAGTPVRLIVRDASKLSGRVCNRMEIVEGSHGDAAMVANLLADSTWTGQKDMLVLGPENLSFNDMAAVISDLPGRELRTSRFP
jgi:uncharacterized protein YbjT (DUF2867 family)